MSQKRPSKHAKNIGEANIAGSQLEGIVRIENPDVLDEISGGNPYGPPSFPPSPPPPPRPNPPWTYPGQTPIPNSPVYGPYPSQTPT